MCAAVGAGLKPYWLSLLGPSGVGKTFLAEQIYKLINQIKPPDAIHSEHVWQPRNSWEKLTNPNRWVAWPRFCDCLRESKWHRVGEVCDAWFVVLDEIGAEYDPTGLMLNKLDQILNTRLGRWTVITSNMTFSEIGKRLDPRIASRMLRANGVVVEIDAPDYATR